MTRRARPTTVTALVTGCSSGIGRATALALHDAGYAVYATARRAETLQDLAGRGITTMALDVTDESSMQAAVQRVVSEHGAVGVLVNNAGYSLTSTVEEAAMDDVRKQFETNVFGLARLCQLVLPSMRAQRWGRIVNIGSMGGRFTLPGGGYYHATKHAVEAISDALRLETAFFGVSVSLIQPGPVQSAFGESAVATMAIDDDAKAGPYAAFNRELAQRYATSYSGKSAERNVRPKDVAKAVVHAAGDHPRPRYAVGVVARSPSPDVECCRMWCGTGSCARSGWRRGSLRSADQPELGPVRLAGFDVAGHGGVEGARLDGIQLDPRRYPEGHGPRRYLGAVRHHRAGPDQCPRAHHDAVQDHRSRAHQAIVLDRAPLQVRVVTDDTVRADQGRQVGGAVDHSAVLDGGALADADEVAVRTQDGRGPDRRAGADLDLSDEHRVRMHPCSRIDVWFVLTEGIDGHGDPSGIDDVVHALCVRHPLMRHNARLERHKRGGSSVVGRASAQRDLE